MHSASYYAYRVEGPTPNGRFEWHWFDRDKILFDPLQGLCRRQHAVEVRIRIAEGRRRSIVQAESHEERRS
jgi:hypothetical protein